MFLIEGYSNAVLYTVDIRAETWWVNSIVQDPTLLPYATGIKTLQTIYLDTACAADRDSCPTFPSKASGLGDLISQIRQYPPDTVFHLNSWTFGYERVWVALSSAFRSQVRSAIDDHIASATLYTSYIFHSIT